MARATFGGTTADTVARRVKVLGHDVDDYDAATLTVWSAQTGGTQYTDLLVNGAASNSVPVDSTGQVPEFQGPDGVTVVWVSAGGARVKMLPAEGPTDTSVAGYVNNTGSSTRAALSAAYAAKAGGNVFTEPQVFKDGPWVDAASVGAVADCITVTDGAMTSGSAVLTSATGYFTAGDVGKVIEVVGAGAAGAVLVSTIASYQSGTQLTLAANAGTSVSGARVYWGTDNTSAINAALARASALAAFSGAPCRVVLRSGKYLLGGAATNGALISYGTVSVVNGPVRLTSHAPSGSQFGGYWSKPAVLIRRPSASATPLLGVAAYGFELENVNLDGGGGSAAAFHCDYGFGLNLRSVRVANVTGTAMKLLAVINGLTDNVVVHDCGAAGSPVVYVGGGGRLDRTGTAATQPTNFINLANLDIENCHTGASLLDLAYDSTAGERAESVYANTIHLESPSATAPLVQVGYATGRLLGGSVYCGSGGAVVQNDQQASHPVGQWFHINDTSLVGSISGTKPTNLITLTAGDGFQVNDSVAANCSGSVLSIASGYGDNVGWTNIRPRSLGATGVTPSGVVTDSRASQGTSTPLGFESVTAYRDLGVGRHLLSTGTSGSPSIAVGAAAGTGATASITGNDVAGVIQLNAGTAPSAGAMVTATFGKAFASAPKAVVLMPANTASANLATSAYVGTTSANFSVNGQATASTTYFWFYVVVG